MASGDGSLIIGTVVFRSGLAFKIDLGMAAVALALSSGIAIGTFSND